ncbi:MAG: acyl carrier protein [Flavobacteriales bacterium]|jgi:acyl carrier protein|nr:acyl carrier protein [Flavobacteriales bacterium]
MKDELTERVRTLLADRLVRIGMRADELDEDLDLVRSGLLDSLAFIDLVAALEQEAGRQVDLEAALEAGDATTIRGLQRLFHEP